MQLVNICLVKSLFDQTREELFCSMYGLRIECDQELTQILEPINQVLDDCWWYLGGAGVTLPLYPGNASVEEVKLQSVEYAQWLDDEAGYRVGKPGWFSRYIDYVDSCWELYFVCESSSSEIPRETLDWLDSFEDRGWFGDAKDWLLPTEVLFVFRDVDHAYLDLFFRDKKYYTMIQEYMQQFDNVKCAPFVEPPNEKVLTDDRPEK